MSEREKPSTYVHTGNEARTALRGAFIQPLVVAGGALMDVAKTAYRGIANLSVLPKLTTLPSLAKTPESPLAEDPQLANIVLQKIRLPELEAPKVIALQTAGLEHVLPARTIIGSVSLNTEQLHTDRESRMSFVKDLTLPVEQDAAFVDVSALDNKDAKSVLQKVYGALKKNGRVVLTAEQLASFETVARVMAHTRGAVHKVSRLGRSDTTYRTGDQIAELLQEAGFPEVQISVYNDDSGKVFHIVTGHKGVIAANNTSPAKRAA